MPHPSPAAPHDRPLGAAPGDILGGRYELQRLLGVGGTGAVFEAKHTTIGRVVALKLLLPEIAPTPPSRGVFSRRPRPPTPYATATSSR